MINKYVLKLYYVSFFRISRQSPGWQYATGHWFSIITTLNTSLAGIGYALAVGHVANTSILAGYHYCRQLSVSY